MSDVTDRELEELDVAECLRLITPGGIGRIEYPAGTAPRSTRSTTGSTRE